MKGLKQFGAMALAAALTITLVAPITARADTEDSNYGVQENTFYDKDVNKDSTTWTNKATGYSYTEKDEEDRDYDAYNKATKSWFGNPKKLQVGVKGFFKFHLYAEAGQSFDGKIKVLSGKDIVSVKQLGKSEREVVPGWDSKAKQYYFRKLDGTKEYVGDLTWDQAYAARRTQYTYSFRLYGKKAGTAKLQYKIDGKKYKIKATVSDDVRPFKSITYAGKSLQLDYNVGATNSNYYAKQSSNKAGNFYTNKKKGKFRVTMNKNFKFVAMYVIKDTDYETKTYTYDNDGYDGSEIERKAVGGIDLNGDGDFLDTINGIKEEDYGDMTYTKYTKKSPKIRLNTSFDKVDSKSTSYYGPNKTYPGKSTYKYTGDVAETTVLLVYQNKLTKGYGLKTITMDYRKSVKK